MPYTITDTCIACDFCRPECPVNAITEGEVLFEIDPETCCDCKGYHDQPRCLEVCPVEDCIVKATDDSPL
jgi:ferredoxin